MILEFNLNGENTVLKQDEINTISGNLIKLLSKDNLLKQESLILECSLDKMPILEISYGEGLVSNLTMEEDFTILILEEDGEIKCLSDNSEIGEGIELKRYSRKEYADLFFNLSIKYPTEIFVLVVNTEDEMFMEYLRGKTNLKVYGIKE